MREYQQVTVSGFILNGKGEVLMVKRSMEDKFLPGLWELPGGGTAVAEHPHIGLKRELEEETGLQVEVIKPISVDDYFMEKQDEKIHRVEIFFLCKLVPKKQEVLLSHEHSEYVWLGKDEMKHLDITDYMQKALNEGWKNL